MCLAHPTRVVELLEGDRARVELDGVIQEVSVALLDDVREGDYVIVHVGFALSRLDPAEAEATLALFARAATTRPAS
ncbi:HypC/HybG/HupF family hydrogenase formation chaperone [Phaeovibrio sulfidiphilus]|uniref:HypC/HybG/HupF family hydrogenase formation chaperone n=1 Tax=Phaeovibrio sulfidiphilus TaxID=1220600 RepID=A0A8J7CD05_9PROT|nr:HypC/HybG/HupF family hydrogenase formation chaperone [Phaeovibrio sulfidiphilus]MBE1236484.1 HypC/HybG/HupF family hydrogenase formation chaperone [Phaeovibrio sulfidiphilus]